MHATICDLITDLVQNSIEASASEITLKVEERQNILKVLIEDNGKGMSVDVLEKAKDPFYSDGLKHSHRKVGLGLPFLYQTTEQTEGSVRIESKEGKGTVVSFQLDPTHVDLPMFGNFTTAVITLLTYGFDGNLTIEHQVGENGYTLSKAELEDALGNLNDSGSLILLRAYVTSQEEELAVL